MTGGQAKPTIAVRRADDRSRTELSWLDSKHPFSFGVDNDQDNLHHGLLLVNNDDTVRAGTGFGTHPHRDMEIVTWVLTRSLVHQDSEGHTGVIYPGLEAKHSTSGRGNTAWRSPRRILRSVGLTPAAMTRMRTWPGRGTRSLCEFEQCPVRRRTVQIPDEPA